MRIIILSTLLVLSACAVLSCNSNTLVAGATSQHKVEQYLVNFTSRHADYSINKIKNEEASQQLQREIYDTLSAGLLSDFPMELTEIKPVEGSYYAHFRIFGESLANRRLYCDLLTKVDKAAVDTLKEKSTYKVAFKNARPCKDESLGSVFWSDRVYIERDPVATSLESFSFGIIEADLAGITRSDPFKYE